MGGIKRVSPLERFTRFVKYNSENGCLEWTGASNKQGYGQISFIRNGKTENWYAHRLSYVLFIGELNSKMELVCHTCDNPKCVSPLHLFKGSHKDNHSDAQNKGRIGQYIHPSRNAYRLGCRCESCHELELAYQREWYYRNIDKMQAKWKRQREKKKSLSLSNSK